MTDFFDVLLGGVFHAAVLFLVAAGLQLVFGVQKIVNLACGSFYALGAYFGITAVGLAIEHGMPPRAVPAGPDRAGLASASSGRRSSGCCARSTGATRRSAAAHVRPRPDVPGRAALLLGRQPAQLGNLSGLRQGAVLGGPGSDL